MVTLGAVVLDCPDPRALADFYAAVLDWKIADADDEWVTLRHPQGGGDVAFQRDPRHQPSSWPDPGRPQMLHLDIRVTDLEGEHERVLGLGATLLDDKAATFRVYADPAGHPFCLCAC